LLVKVCKKALLVSVVVVLFASAAMAAASDSVLVGASGGDGPVANSALVGGGVEPSEYTKVAQGGFHVTYTGLWKHGNTLEASYTIVSERNRRVAIEFVNSYLVDANDVTIPTTGRNNPNVRLDFGRGLSVRGNDWVNGFESIGAGLYINGEKQDVAEFTANQSYNVMLRLWVPAEYLLTPTFNSVTLVINGLPVTFEAVPIYP